MSTGLETVIGVAHGGLDRGPQGGLSAAVVRATVVLHNVGVPHAVVALRTAGVDHAAGVHLVIGVIHGEEVRHATEARPGAGLGEETGLETTMVGVTGAEHVL